MSIKKSMLVLLMATMVMFLMVLENPVQQNMSASANENNIQSLANNSSTLANVVLAKGESKVKVPLITYAMIAGNNTSLNGYTLKYVVSGEEKIYSLMDYVLYFASGDMPSSVIDKLANANLSKEVTGISQGEIIDGKLTESGVTEENPNEDFEVEDIE